ncbi:GIY-YIG nuclease family protein [Halioglobus maricola]|uniref:GIY-YIG nuclease family protein n=2 Tax=Halioglobus maricola TaxID=2601894 RepID=A0A5P9NQB2_9GAMM|nr:GIY-YIG nuclease family protein [Halioglobus maricola]
MSQPYTIRLFVPDGNPDDLKIIDKMNWTGVGLEVSRDSWSKHRARPEFNQAGVYILVGYEEADDLPTVYVGQGDGVLSRIDAHEKEKDFWDRALTFVSSNGGLNRAHITWLEWALIKKAAEASRCKLANGNTPKEPVLTESEKADTRQFLNEILSVLPLVEIRLFEKATIIKATDNALVQKATTLDTIIVPAQQDGFNEVFVGENCWYAIRIGGGKLKDIKYIAAYQTAPVSAVTHFAQVESIEPYGDGGKYKLNFTAPAQKIGPITYGNAKQGMMQSPRYTTHERLINASSLDDLFPN